MPLSHTSVGIVLRPTPPGRTLAAEMEERGLSANALALNLRVPANRISEIVRNKRAITAETALRLGRAFGTSAEFWLNLQRTYDLRMAESRHGENIKEEVRQLVGA